MIWYDFSFGPRRVYAVSNFVARREAFGYTPDVQAGMSIAQAGADRATSDFGKAGGARAQNS